MNIYADYDDTLVAAGKVGVSGQDTQYQPHVPYPGIAALIDRLRFASASFTGADSPTVPKRSVFFGDSGQGDVVAMKLITRYLHERHADTPGLFYGFVHWVTDARMPHHEKGYPNIVYYRTASDALAKAKRALLCEQKKRPRAGGQVYILTARPAALQSLPGVGKTAEQMRREADIRSPVIALWGDMAAGLRWAHAVLTKDERAREAAKLELGKAKATAWAKTQLPNGEDFVAWVEAVDMGHVQARTRKRTCSRSRTGTRSRSRT